MNATPTSPMVAPPPDELADLLDLAQLGNLLEIEKQAGQIEKRGEQFRSFVHRLHQLIEDLEDQQVITFIEQFIEEDR